MALTIDLKGKVALITGVTSAIGLRIAKIMAKAGCTVIGCAAQSETSDVAQRFLTEMESYDIHTDYFRADTNLAEDLEGVVADISSDYGRLDILVSNAGKNVFAGLARSTEKDWQFNLGLNLAAHWRLAKKCKPLMAENIAVLLITASGYAYASLMGGAPDSIVRTGLTGLVKNQAMAWGAGISKVGIIPDFIAISGDQEWLNTSQHSETEIQKTADCYPVNKTGTTEETGGWCMFLASEYAAFAPGITYWVDDEQNAVIEGA